MLWLLIGIVASVFIIVKCTLSKSTGKLHGFFKGLLCTIPALATVLACWLLSSLLFDTIIKDDGKTYTLYDKSPIFSLEEEDEKDNCFSLGYGFTNNDVMYYSYRTDAEHEQIEARSLDIRTSHEASEPYVEKYICRYNNPILDLIASPGSLRYIMYFPEGTIVSDYEISEN